VLLIYKTPKVGQWVGTVLLHCCELIERPSKKDGFCFKLFHPLDQSVWAVKVPPGRLGEPGWVEWLIGSGDSSWARDLMWSPILHAQAMVDLRVRDGDRFVPRTPHGQQACSWPSSHTS
jgi:hypothetical protein